MVKDPPNNVPLNNIVLSQTSREIFKYGDVPIFLVVLITPDSLQLTVIVPVSHYPPSARSLIQYLYDLILSSIMRQNIWIFLKYMELDFMKESEKKQSSCSDDSKMEHSSLDSQNNNSK